MYFNNYLVYNIQNAKFYICANFDPDSRVAVGLLLFVSFCLKATLISFVIDSLHHAIVVLRRQCCILVVARSFFQTVEICQENSVCCAT